MIIPSGITEEKVFGCIEKVINKIAPRYVFYGYSLEDIKQESFIICMDALNRYEPGRPLENFLSVHLSNRLKNFVRDNHYVSTDDESRIKVMQPAQLDHETSLIDFRQNNIEDEKIDYGEMQKIIDANLPAIYRLDYLKMINDVYVNRQRKEEIVLVIKEILEENGYEKRPHI